MRQPLTSAPQQWRRLSDGRVSITSGVAVPARLFPATPAFPLFGRPARLLLFAFSILLRALGCRATFVLLFLLSPLLLQRLAPGLLLPPQGLCLAPLRFLFPQRAPFPL
jgi:hypothetical protein